jgi:hypothetical protein
MGVQAPVEFEVRNTGVVFSEQPEFGQGRGVAGARAIFVQSDRARRWLNISMPAQGPRISARHYGSPVPAGSLPDWNNRDSVFVSTE